MTNNIHKDHDQSNKKPIPNKQTTSLNVSLTVHHELTIQNYQRDALNTIYSSNIITLLYQYMDRHYIHLNKKLDQLSVKQPKRSAQPRREDDCHFYTRVKNLTNIRFSQEEMHLLKYGLN